MTADPPSTDSPPATVASAVTVRACEALARTGVPDGTRLVMEKP